MHSLPKTRKKSTPVRLILCMTGSSHHELGKWLAGLLQSVLKWFSSQCLSDSFTLLRPCKILTSLLITSCVLLMCPVWFINVPLDETIKICSDAFYDQSDFQPVISKDVFVELTKIATSSVEFSFKNAMYKQTDGMIVGSPLSLDLANTFVGYFNMKISYFLKRRSLQHTSVIVVRRASISTNTRSH